MHRFFVPPQAIDGETVVLSGNQAHHLRTVLRIRPGQTIELFDGTGAVYRTEIKKSTENTIEGHIIGHVVESAKTDFPLTLAQGILKGKKMDLVLQKATELGVDTLMPVLTRYCQQQKNLERRLQRWQRIVLEACKQCGRPTPMRITPVVTLQDIPVPSFHYPLLCWEGEEQAMVHPELFTIPGKVLLLIGPEGGFHKQEVQWAGDQGFQSVTLGPLVLRAETAAIAAVGIIQYLTRLQAARLQE
ncbi:MAG: 16S rRNA (uracil(1498)-N(3))-methyltransferase [Desulfobulbaceae bacterium]|nr:16S rRNA (uracil(1498)-N(3))-methyltransferase [Desulfobulbaceae bacterium]